MSAHPIDRGVTAETVWRFPLGLTLIGVAAGVLSACRLGTASADVALLD